jgi:ribosomal protein S30
MAHGGLAQAGKVRGKTPVVAKKEKTHKRVCGRAHKREQYTRMIERIESGTRDGPNKQPKGKLG